MTWHGFLAQTTLAAAMAGTIGALGMSFAGIHLNELRDWQRNAVSAPEGDATAALFAHAVEAGAIRWEPALRAIVLRRELDLPPNQAAQLFKVGEAGAVIATEIARAAAQNGALAIRVRSDECDTPCDYPDWTLEAADAPRGSVEALALGASLSRSSARSAPSPRLNAAMGRGAGTGWGEWTSWDSQGALIVSADLAAADRIDVIGRLGAIPEGWTPLQLWCRSDRGRLQRCDRLEASAAARLARTAAQTGDTNVRLAPVPVLPARPPAGQHRVSERIMLDCDADACRPVWLAQPGTRAYARPTGAPAPARAGNLLAVAHPAQDALGPWVDAGETGLVPSALADSTGASAILGAGGNGLIAALVGLTNGEAPTASLDPGVQRITQDVLRELTDRAAGGAFQTLDYRIPAEGPMVSLVVLDLRDGGRQGAILASAGLPNPPADLDGWTAAAVSFDPETGMPPGPPAWTGRGSHHTPGSTWKMVSALSLIDAATDPDMPPPLARDLREVLLGLDSAGADLRLGPGLLTAPGGVCPPRSLETGPAPAPAGDDCGPAHFKPVQDSGRGGPLLGQGSAQRFGLTEAISKSSNIWFVSTLLRAEAGWHGQGHPPGALLARTVDRLGLSVPLPLDTGLGLRLAPRDAAEIEALRPGADIGMLARASFGQQVQAGPLVIAQVAAAIATGKDVRPGLLLPLAEPEPLFPQPGAAPLLAALRDGMKGAVQSADLHGLGRGTAYNTFTNRAPEIRDRVFGKTGTANRSGDPRDNTSTFAGWMESDDGLPLVAVSCATTLRGIPRGTGVSVPQVCAHASAELLARLSAEGFGS